MREMSLNKYFTWLRLWTDTSWPDYDLPKNELGELLVDLYNSRWSPFKNGMAALHIQIWYILLFVIYISVFIDLEIVVEYCNS